MNSLRIPSSSCVCNTIRDTVLYPLTCTVPVSKMPVSSEEVTEAFETLGIDLKEPRVIDLFGSLCDIYKMDADSLSTEVLAFMFKRKMGTDSPPTEQLLRDMEKEVLKKMEENRARKRERGIADVTNLIE